MEISKDLDSMQLIVKGPIEHIQLGKTLCMIANEEGLLRKDLKTNFLASLFYGSEIKGDVFLCSYSGGEDYESITDSDFKRVVDKLKEYRKIGVIRVAHAEPTAPPPTGRYS
jgi:hypothetical protein